MNLLAPGGDGHFRGECLVCLGRGLMFGATPAGHWGLSGQGVLLHLGDMHVLTERQDSCMACILREYFMNVATGWWTISCGLDTQVGMPQLEFWEQAWAL